MKSEISFHIGRCGSKHIKEIIYEIVKRLNPKHFHIEDELVGLDFHLNELKSLLSYHLNVFVLLGFMKLVE